MLIAIVVILVLIFYLKFVYKIKVKWSTFFKKGFRPKRGQFGLYTYVGKQGKGKTYSMVEYLIDHNKNIKVFSNINNIDGVDDITYYVGFKGLIKIKEDLDAGLIKTNKQLVIVYDEIFTELQKKSVLGKDVLDFLCQMRKRGIIFLTSAQEWPEIPLTFRRFCRYQIDCNMFSFLGIGILFKVFRDAENMKWSEEDQEHIAPIVDFTISHCRLSVANSYDTFLRISSVAPSGATEEEKSTNTSIPTLNNNISIVDDFKPSSEHGITET